MCSCDQALEWISAALDGELTAGEQQELDGHLAVCGACRALADELRDLSGRMPEEVEVPEGFHRQVMDRIAAEQVLAFPMKKQKKQPWRSWVSLAAVFAVVLLGAGVSKQMGYLTGGSSGVAEPQAAAGSANIPEQYSANSADKRTAPAAADHQKPGETEQGAQAADEIPGLEGNGTFGGQAAPEEAAVSEEPPAPAAIPAPGEAALPNGDPALDAAMADPSVPPAPQAGGIIFGVLGTDPAQIAVDNSRVWLAEVSLTDTTAVDTDIVSVAALTQAEQALVVCLEETQAQLDLTDWVVTLGDPAGQDFVRVVCDSVTGEVIGYLPAE